MKINFNDIQPDIQMNFRGGEGKLTIEASVDELNRIMLATLEKGAYIGLHRHDTSSEIMYIVSGRAKIITDGVEEILTAGECSYCKKGSEHITVNIGDGDLVFFGVVPQQ